MTRNFTPTSDQRKEKRNQTKSSLRSKGENEQRSTASNSKRIRYWTPTFRRPKPNSKIDKLIISLPKSLPINIVIKRINNALEELL